MGDDSGDSFVCIRRREISSKKVPSSSLGLGYFNFMMNDEHNINNLILHFIALSEAILHSTPSFNVDDFMVYCSRIIVVKLTVDMIYFHLGLPHKERKCGK